MHSCQGHLKNIRFSSKNMFSILRLQESLFVKIYSTNFHEIQVYFIQYQSIALYTVTPKPTFSFKLLLLVMVKSCTDIHGKFDLPISLLNFILAGVMTIEFFVTHVGTCSL